jgi:hypothetical protein
MLDIAVFMDVWPCILVESMHINWTDHKAMAESQLFYKNITLIDFSNVIRFNLHRIKSNSV